MGKFPIHTCSIHNYTGTEKCPLCDFDYTIMKNFITKCTKNEYYTLKLVQEIAIDIIKQLEKTETNV